MLKHGKNGKGIRSRWYPGTLASRLEHMRFVVGRMLSQGADGLKVVEEYTEREDVLSFIAPPYTGDSGVQLIVR